MMRSSFCSMASSRRKAVGRSSSRETKILTNDSLVYMSRFGTSLLEIMRSAIVHSQKLVSKIRSGELLQRNV